MKRALLALLAVLAFCGTASAQGYYYSQPVINSRGLPAPGANAAVCTTIATTAAAISNNLATLTMASNPITAGFTAGGTIVVSNFTGSDTYLNGNYQIAAVSSTAILFSLTHADASASSNGSVVQEGTSQTACAPLATIYTDQTLTTSSPNPFTADGLGNLNFWATPAQYYGFVYGPTVDPTLSPLSVPCMPGSACGGGSCPGIGTASLAQLYNNAGSCAGEDWTYFAAGDPNFNAGGDILGPMSLGPGKPGPFGVISTTMDPNYYDINGQYVHCEDCWEARLTYDDLNFNYFNPDTMTAGGLLDLNAAAGELHIAQGGSDSAAHYTFGSLYFIDTLGNFGGYFISADAQTAVSTEARFYDSTGSGNYASIMGPQTLGITPNPICPPTTNSTAGQTLVSDGGTSPCQQLSWSSSGGGGVSSVAGISGFIGVTDPTTTAQLTLTNPITAQLIFSGTTTFPQFNGGFGCATGSAPSATSGFDILYCDSATGNLMLSNNAGGFGRVLTGTVGVANGGTGLTTLTAFNLLCANGTSAPTFIPPVMSSYVLTDNGPGACPTFQAGPTGMSSSLDTITAAMGAATIGNGDNNIRWNWHLTTNSGTAMYFGESSASTATGSFLLRSSTLASSTASPFQADNNGNGLKMSTVGVLGKIGTGSVDYTALSDFPTACTNQFATQIAATAGCASVDLTNATQVTGALPLNRGGTAQTAAPVKRAEFTLASCNLQVSPSSSGAGLPASGGMSPGCKTDGTNGTVQGILAAAHSNAVYFTWNVPADWVSFNSAAIQFTTTDTTTGHTVIFDVQTACTTPNGGNTDTPTYNSANAFTTVTIGGGAVANALYSTTAGTVTGTGCAAGRILHIKLTRSGADTSTDTAIALTGSLVLAYNGAYN